MTAARDWAVAPAGAVAVGRAVTDSSRIANDMPVAMNASSAADTTATVYLPVHSYTRPPTATPSAAPT